MSAVCGVEKWHCKNAQEQPLPLVEKVELSGCATGFVDFENRG
jgi:hypothetical protein